jgi:hypothetical protein
MVVKIIVFGSNRMNVGKYLRYTIRFKFGLRWIDHPDRIQNTYHSYLRATSPDAAVAIVLIVISSQYDRTSWTYTLVLVTAVEWRKKHPAYQHLPSSFTLFRCKYYVSLETDGVRARALRHPVENLSSSSPTRFSGRPTRTKNTNNIRILGSCSIRSTRNY